MAVFVTGDIHRNPVRLSKDSFYEQKIFSGNKDENIKYDVSSFEELIANARNKAIDDYMNKLCNHCMQQTNECYKLECPFCTDGCDIVNISEQLKAGIIND